MKYDELSKIALSLAVKVLVKAVGVYDLAQLRDMQGVIIAEFLPMLRAPEPVDDKALAEAIKYTQYLSAQGGCEPAPWGPHKQLQLEIILSALHAAQREVARLSKPLCNNAVETLATAEVQKEVAELREDKERLDKWSADLWEAGVSLRKHAIEAKGMYGVDGTSIVEVFDEVVSRMPKARAAGEGKGAT